MLIERGQAAPVFSAPTDQSGDFVLSAFRGSSVILYFYPKDGTPGCSMEACSFRDWHDRFAEATAVIAGISRDGIDDHRNFREKLALQFPLISDPDGTICALYGVLGQDGRIVRSTFLIDPDGVVSRIWRNVDINQHADEVMRALKSVRK